MPVRPLTNSKVKPAVTKDEQLACIILNSATTTVTINKNTGFIDYIDVNGKPILEDGYSLKPDFWRAPTDNDYGASLQTKLGVWKNPTFNLKSLKSENEGICQKVVAQYDMPEVKASLTLTYTLNSRGKIIVEEQFVPNDSLAKYPIMPRFGMTMVLPKDFDYIHYYGRGPIEITGTAILQHSWASIHKAYLNNIQLIYDRKSVATKRTFAGGVSTMTIHRKVSRLQHPALSK